MFNQISLNVKKPISVWNQDLALNPKDFFSALVKATISGICLDVKGTTENLVDVFKSITPENKPAYAAWLLIYRSLQQSLIELVNEYQEFVDKNITPAQYEDISTTLEEALGSIEVEIDTSFFEQPQKLKVLADIKAPLTTWLAALGLNKNEATALLLRLPERFILSLHNQYRTAPQDYNCIEEALDSPFIKATKEQLSWIQYRAWLQEQPNQRMFAEAFSLKQVFVPLRAYYKIKNKDGDNSHKAEQNHNTEEQANKVVVNLQENICDWVNNFNKDDAIKIIRGGPGSGKSSFTKMFAAHVAQYMADIPVIFIPLHHFDPSEELTTAVEQFIRDDQFLSGSPLDVKTGQQRLLIIFDGLDELSMQGKAAAETAQNFIEEVITKIDRHNDQGCQRQVLITGREVAVQAAIHKLRGKNKVLHVLPYLVEETEREQYIDENKLLSEDQRNQWWKKYSKAKGLTYKKLPKALDIKHLIPITTEPLLNYLVALSFAREKIEFSDETTLNVIYKDLLQSVHQRQWDHGSHKGANHLQDHQFVRVLEEVALTVWHSGGRTATINDIYERCTNNNLTQYLEEFQEGAKKGVTKLLTAFYFRQSEKQENSGDKTFEFTHKSFGEYLIALRIVRSIKQIHKGITEYENDPDEGFSLTVALQKWVHICGPTMMDEYVFKFLCNEIAAYKDSALQWQGTFIKLLSHTVKNSMPMENVGISKFKDMATQARNAEECLLVVHHACALQTRQVIKVNDVTKFTNFGLWFKRLSGNIKDGNKLARKCISYLDLSSSNFIFSDLFDCDLSGCNLNSINLGVANLMYSQCINSSFINASLYKANLEGANLEGANLTDADLTRANLTGANLTDADLTRANLTGANLTDADLTRADLTDANLTDANLTGADLTRGNLTGANLTDAILEGAKMPEGYEKVIRVIKDNK